MLWDLSCFLALPELRLALYESQRGCGGLELRLTQPPHASPASSRPQLVGTLASLKVKLTLSGAAGGRRWGQDARSPRWPSSCCLRRGSTTPNGLRSFRSGRPSPTSPRRTRRRQGENNCSRWRRPGRGRHAVPAGKRVAGCAMEKMAARPDAVPLPLRAPPPLSLSQRHAMIVDIRNPGRQGN